MKSQHFEALQGPGRDEGESDCNRQGIQAWNCGRALPNPPDSSPPSATEAPGPLPTDSCPSRATRSPFVLHAPLVSANNGNRTQQSREALDGEARGEMGGDAAQGEPPEVEDGRDQLVCFERQVDKGRAVPQLAGEASQLVIVGDEHLEAREADGSRRQRFRIRAKREQKKRQG